MIKEAENEVTKKERIYSVSEYIEVVNIALKKFRVKVAGEVTEVDDRGHIWFSIKDKEKESILECVIWQSNYRICGVKIEEGIELILTGYADIYPRSGQFKFKAEVIELKGEGLLKKAYEELKKKLTEEGLFAVERKRPLPELPQKIGVITSRQGAVINDLLANLGKFGFKIKMIDSRVEGQEAVKELLAAVKAFRKIDIDVLVIMRGGGSLEALQAFNNEMLVRTVIDFPTPVIAAIGHEKDVPLVSLAADAACSTPTAAAHLVNASWERVPLKIHHYERFIFENFTKNLFQVSSALWHSFSDLSGRLRAVFENYEDLEQDFRDFLSLIREAIKAKRERLDYAGTKIIDRYSAQLREVVQKLFFMARAVQANNPEKNLALGYCIARKNNRVVKSVEGVQVGEELDLQMRDGIIGSKVSNINKNKKYDNANK